MLSIQNLTLSTRQPILQGFSHQFQLGQFYLITAVNGSGKTTFFRALVNLAPIDQGTITFDEQPFTQQKRRFFYYESSNWLDPNMTGMDYLKLVKQLWQSQVNIAEEIHYWQMTEYIKLPIKHYSLGMKQKLLIAMYIISDACYLFMDEISNGLDDNSRQKLLDRLQTLSVAKCILLTSHYHNEAAPIADQILELKNQTMAVLPA